MASHSTPKRAIVRRMGKRLPMQRLGRLRRKMSVALREEGGDGHRTRGEGLGAGVGERSRAICSCSVALAFVRAADDFEPLVYQIGTYCFHHDRV